MTERIVGVGGERQSRRRRRRSRGRQQINLELS